LLKKRSKLNESRSDSRKLASYEVAGISADKIICPERTMENSRMIPSAFQDVLFYDGVPGTVCRAIFGSRSATIETFTSSKRRRIINGSSAGKLPAQTGGVARSTQQK